MNRDTKNAAGQFIVAHELQARQKAVYLNCFFPLWFDPLPSCSKCHRERLHRSLPRDLNRCALWPCSAAELNSVLRFLRHQHHFNCQREEDLRRRRFSFQLWSHECGIAYCCRHLLLQRYRIHVHSTKFAWALNWNACYKLSCTKLNKGL